MLSAAGGYGRFLFHRVKATSGHGSGFSLLMIRPAGLGTTAFPVHVTIFLPQNSGLKDSGTGVFPAVSTLEKVPEGTKMLCISMER